MKDVLIGHTGFVGSALSRQFSFDIRCNSTNADDIVGGHFGTVVCAAAPGSMIAANRAPMKDAENLQKIMDHLRRLKAKKMILISTIAVLEDFNGMDNEDTRNFQSAVPYGRHRRQLEVFCREQFKDCLILRLPALYGAGLQKNFIFDILNPVPSMLSKSAMERAKCALPPNLRIRFGAFYSWNTSFKMYQLDRKLLKMDPKRKPIESVLKDAGMTSLQFTNSQSTFQYYGLHRLWKDATRAIEAGLDVLHLATEPVTAKKAYSHLTGLKMPSSDASLHIEDFRTKHGELFGGRNGYIQTQDEVLEQIKGWIDSERDL